MMFADNIVLVGENWAEANQSLNEWRLTLEEKELRISINKTEYMSLEENNKWSIKQKEEWQ